MCKLPSPPDHALVLAVDEKSQIQALGRTAPYLPMLPATPERRTRDYVRHGTTSLFAAYDLASGSVIAQHYRRHRHQEFLRFLELIDSAVPKDLDLHLVERWFAELTSRKLRRSAHRSVTELETDIRKSRCLSVPGDA